MDKVSADFDQLMRFWLDTAPARGVVVRLEESLTQAMQHHDYPDAVVALLRQLAGAAALLACNLKQSAQVILQAQGSGDVPLLCVEATDALTFRLYASVREGATIAPDASLYSLVAPDGEGRFVLTISPTDGQIYQGIVALSEGSVAALLETYLSNSQQTDTRMWLRQDGDVKDATSAWSAVVAQANHAFSEHFMPFPYSEWLQFTFAQHTVKVSPAQPVKFACSCTMERVLNALKLVGEAELQPLIEAQGKIATRCEFCGKAYEVSAASFAELLQ